MTTKQFIAVIKKGNINGYDADSCLVKAEWHKTGKKILNSLAKELGLAKGTYDIRSNMAGVAVSGEVTLHGENIYVQLSESCLGPDWGFMWRTCKGRKDYTGGANQWARWDMLNDLPSLANIMNKMLDTCKFYEKIV